MRIFMAGVISAAFENATAESDSIEGTGEALSRIDA